MGKNKNRIVKFFLKNKKNNIVILSDSLSLPRVDKDATVLLEESYPYLLQKKIGSQMNVINRGIRFTTTNSLNDFQYLFDNLLIYSPKTIIIQIGIVDCAPRLFSPLFRAILGKISNEKIKNIFIYPFKKNRRFFTRFFPMKLVKKDQFKSNLENFLLRISEFKIDVKIVNIPDTNSKNNFKSFNFNRSINDYNKAISDLLINYNFDLIDINKFSKKDNILLDDGIHYNMKGSVLLSKLLYESIK